VVASGAAVRMLPFSMPRPLFQIGIGALIGVTGTFHVTLDPEIFFLLFLPPLLFLDGWRIPREELSRDGVTILALALGLVLFTVLGAGLFIHWLVPGMPMATAFALAAVLSPTDPIAVSAIAQRVPIPRRMMHILEGESLLNDASGLVCLRFAVAAALTGTFSISLAGLSFLWMALGGVTTGAGLTWVVTRTKSRISARFGEDSGSHILISLLIPFGAYLLAEWIHCSGILAAVAAGLTMGLAETSGPVLAVTRIRRNTVWDMIQFAANGIIFVLLGEQLPAILKSATLTVQTTGHHTPWWLLAYILAITIGLAVLRFAWVWVSLHLTIFRDNQASRSTRLRTILAMTFAGVRGAITLAGVLTLPLTMPNGAPFPARDLGIFLAMGVIITSLFAGSLVLPLLLKGLDLPLAPTAKADDDRARVAAAEAAIAEIERVQHRLSEGRSDADLYVSAAGRIMDEYRERIEGRTQGAETSSLARRADAIDRDLRLAALRAERTEILRKVRARKLSSVTARKIIRELDHLEARYSA
jgi:Na+/H+ antiporter